MTHVKRGHPVKTEQKKPETKSDEYLSRLISILLKQQNLQNLSKRNEKLKRILLLLAKGATLATLIIAPGTAKLFKDINWDKSSEDDWKIFNVNYLRRTIRKLEKEKIVEIEQTEDFGIVKLTKKGKTKILKFSLESLTVSKPIKWDGKWRFVFYDIVHGKRFLRDKFRTLLKNAGFYQIQESVYLHAYPCDEEIEFLRSFLGISAEVRIIEAVEIENDKEFREYFNV